MKKENINDYYTDEDLINFEKLKNFKEFKVNKLNNNQNNNHPVRYAVSDNRNFNKIMNIDYNESSSKKVNKTKDYTPSDFENFKKLKQFATFNDSETSIIKLNLKKLSPNIRIKIKVHSIKSSNLKVMQKKKMKIKIM